MRIQALLMIIAAAVFTLAGPAGASHLDCARAWPGNPTEATRAWAECKERDAAEHAQMAREKQRDAQRQAAEKERRELAEYECREARFSREEERTYCALQVAPLLDCAGLDGYACRQRARALAVQVWRRTQEKREAEERDERRTRALEDANRRRSCTTTRSRVYPYEITTVCE